MGLSWILFYLVLSLLVLLGLKFLWSRKHLYWASMKYNGPLALPLVGNGFSFWCKDEDILSVINKLISTYSQKKPARYWLGFELLIASQNPAHVEKIMSSSKFSHKHDLYKFLKIYLGEGLVSGSGPKYKSHRRIIQPMMNLKFCQEQIEMIQHYTAICMNQLEEYVDKDYFDVRQVTHKCFVDIIGDCILGTKMECLKNGYSEFCRAAIDMYRIGFKRLTRPWLHIELLYSMTSLKKKQDAIVSIINKFMSDVIKESRERIQNDSYKISEASSIIDKITEHIYYNPGAINDKDFISHMITLYAAAEDTMTIISSFVIMCFGMYPEYQTKAVDELRNIIGETPRPVVYEDILKLNYLDMCIKDAERLSPIAPYILRKSPEDVEIDDTLKIPKDCCIIVPIYNIHHDPQHWENPQHFYPDHFLPEAVEKRHIYAYVPFSAGPRGCIGKIFSNICLKVFLCNFLQSYEVEAEGKLPDIKMKMDISVRPVNGYNIKLKRRTW